MTSNTSLSKALRADTSAERIARLWQGVSARLRPAPSSHGRRLVPAVALGTLALAVALGFVVVTRSSPSSSPWQSAALETAGDRLAVDLQDGSRLEVAAESRIELAESTPKSMRLELRRGAIACDVRHDPNRRFTVVADGVEVRVTGTRFRVALAPSGERVEVEVERGSVEVLSGNQERRLAAGESWSVTRARGAPAPESSALVPAPAPKAPATSAETAPSTAESPDRAAPETPEPLDPASARELLDAGNAARRAGDVGAAVQAYELLIAKYPRDARAGLAAFELGRLRLDRLGNPRGAVHAFERAIPLLPRTGLREDAMARLVTAHAALGATERCRAAQRAYLASYPSGVHAAAVAKQCGVSRK